MAIAQAIRYQRWEYPEPGTKKSFLLSLAAHSLLALMFSIGLNWKTSSTPAGVEVELWDSTPVQVEEVVPLEKPVTIVDEKAEIVTEKKKVEPKVEPPKKVEVKPVIPPKPIEKEKPKPEVKSKPEPKVEAPKEKPKAPPVDAKQQAADEKERADRISKLRADAGNESGGTGGTSGTGTGTGGVASPGYADKVRRAIKPRITYTNASQVEGNPDARVVVDLAPDGKILSRRLSKSSGLPDWDAAVLRAIDDTGSLPKDENGTVPKSIVLIFRPKD